MLVFQRKPLSRLRLFWRVPFIQFVFERIDIVVWFYLGLCFWLCLGLHLRFPFLRSWRLRVDRITFFVFFRSSSALGWDFSVPYSLRKLRISSGRCGIRILLLTITLFFCRIVENDDVSKRTTNPQGAIFGHVQLHWLIRYFFWSRTTFKRHARNSTNKI